MPKVIFIVDKDDHVSDLVDALKYLNTHHVSIDKETQIYNVMLPSSALIPQFEGTTDEIIALLSERAQWCAGDLTNTCFMRQTTVTLEN